MSISDRIEGTIESWSQKWKGRLAGWMVSWLASGATKTLEDMEPGIIDQVRETIQQIIDNPQTPLATKAMLEKSLQQGNIFHVAMGWILSVIGLIPALFGLGGPIGNVFNHMQELAMRSQLLDPMMAVTAWRRDPEKYTKFIDDLKSFGLDDERIEAFKFATQYMPTPQQVIAWLAHEVFEPEMIAKYGLDDEFGGLDLTIPKKIGMTDEMSLNEWRNHWQHASWTQVVEMVRRGQMTEPDVWEWFRLVEIPPYWRDKLIAISWEVPTRVDVRRFWDMRTINEERLREIYTAQGYHGKDLEDYVLWTKIYVDFPDLMTRYKNGWLTLDEVRGELVSLGMSAERAEELIQTKVKAVASEKLVKQKDLTMSQIVKGVKKAVITREEGSVLLQDMGYDPYEASFILSIEIPQDEVITEVKIRELTKSDILSGLKAGIITEEEALSKLLDLRYLPEDARFILSIYQATVKPPAEPRQREASKADIVKAVKTGLITPEEAYLMLQDIGFTPEASQFILMVQAESSPFSPMSYNEFKDLTQKYRVVAGREAKPMSEELRAAAAEVVKLTREVESLEAAVKEEEKTLVSEEVLPEAATKKVKKIQVALHRAEAALAAARSNYDKLLAEWRHSA